MTNKELENGCGYQETYDKSSFCKKGNLCIDCKEHLEIYQEARKEVIEDELRWLNGVEEWITEEDICMEFRNRIKQLKELKGEGEK